MNSSHSNRRAIACCATEGSFKIGLPKSMLSEVVLEQWSFPKTFLVRPNCICVIMTRLTAQKCCDSFPSRC